VLYERSLVGSNIGKYIASNVVEANYAAKKSGKDDVIDIVFENSFGDKRTNYTAIAAGLLDADFDAIFIVHSSDRSIELIDEIRKRNINQPIILSQGVSAWQRETLLDRSYDDIFYTGIVPALTESEEQKPLRAFWSQFESNMERTLIILQFRRMRLLCCLPMFGKLQEQKIHL